MESISIEINDTENQIRKFYVVRILFEQHKMLNVWRQHYSLCHLNGISEIGFEQAFRLIA